MKCRSIQKQLSAYMDGESSPKREKIIQSHLQECGACRETLKAMNRAWDLLNELPVPEAGPYFYTRLKARMTAENQTKRRRWMERLLIPVSTFVVVILGIVVGSIVGSNGKQQAEAAVVDEEYIVTYADNFENFTSVSLGEVYLDLSSQER